MKRLADGELLCDARLVCIDAGGTVFKTTRQTLLGSVHQFPCSRLPELVPPDAAMEVTVQVDTDPEIFRHVLQLVRRPPLAHAAPPPFVWHEAWHAELDYWGLTERVLGPEERSAEQQQREQRRNLRALQKIGEEAWAQVQDNEVQAIRTLLDQSGYTASKDKGREKTLHVPLDKYPMHEGGEDLGRYLQRNAATVADLLGRCLGPCCTVQIATDRHVKNYAKYTFADVAYDAETTDTLQVKLKFGDKSVCKPKK